MSDLISSDLDKDLKNAWRTDPKVFSAVYNEFNFDLDAAASKENALCSVFLTKEDNALECDWSQITLHHETDITVKTVFVNPPYGRGLIKKFMSKCVEQKHKGVTSVLLVPATLDAQWLPINEISEIRVITGGRIHFYHPVTNKKIAGNPKGSMFVIFRPIDSPCFVRLIDRNGMLGK